MRRSENSELVHFDTDKSGRMSADTLRGFWDKMSIHVDVSSEVDFAEVDRIQNINNAKSKCWMRIVNAGASWGHEKRIMQAVSTESGMPPVLYGLPKDHKEVPPGQEPPLRPVC